MQTDIERNRKTWLGHLAKADEGRVATLLNAVMSRPDFTWLRAPEIGTVMVQGRANGTGAPFNVGEITVTRATLRIAGGTVGHAYIQGRRTKDAEAVAIVDALMQTDMADTVRTAVIDPIHAEYTKSRATRAAKAAATKVDFFTMVRGDD